MICPVVITFVIEEAEKTLQCIVTVKPSAPRPSIDLTIAKATLIGGSDDDTTSEYMDLNCDHKFDTADAVLLKSFILGEIISFEKTADNEYDSVAG